MNKSIHKSIEFFLKNSYTYSTSQKYAQDFFLKVPEKYSGGTCKEADNCLLAEAERLPYLFTLLV